MKQISGNRLLVKALKEEGVDVLFGYPGACTIDISDELYKQNNLDIILPRHEQALVHEADAYARTTGKVGVCLVTSGPGATNLVTGIATAHMDSIPIVAITCNVGLPLLGKDSFQEQKDGTLLFYWIFSDKNHLIRWLLTFGADVKVLEPSEIKEEIKAVVEQIRRNYQEE